MWSTRLHDPLNNATATSEGCSEEIAFEEASAQTHDWETHGTAAGRMALVSLWHIPASEFADSTRIPVPSIPKADVADAKEVWAQRTPLLESTTRKPA